MIFYLMKASAGFAGYRVLLRSEGSKASYYCFLIKSKDYSYIVLIL